MGEPDVMQTPSQLMSEFVRAHRAGEDPDPRSYLARVDGVDRAELDALIDDYLARQPRRRWDPGAFAASGLEAQVQRIAAETQVTGETWVTLLAALRARARLTRDEVAARLSARLGVSGREARVKEYLHEMEHELLDPARIRPSVFEALAAVLGTTAEQIRAAGRLRPQPPPAAGGAFARTAAPSGPVPAYPAAAPPPPPVESAPPPASPGTTESAAKPDPDPVDDLFTGA